jgi:hypothetical protein
MPILRSRPGLVNTRINKKLARIGPTRRGIEAIWQIRSMGPTQLRIIRAPASVRRLRAPSETLVANPIREQCVLPPVTLRRPRRGT